MSSLTYNETCKRCELHLYRKKVVAGEGPMDAQVMLVGEAPGSAEDSAGRPFCGHAGGLLNRMLRRMGVRRQELYITNVVKCRPPNNRRPFEWELEICRPYLKHEVLAVKPKMIIALGRTAAEQFYGMFDMSMLEIHGWTGRLSVFGFTTRVAITYHPAAALRRKELRSEIMEDLEEFFEEDDVREVR